MAHSRPRWPSSATAGRDFEASARHTAAQIVRAARRDEFEGSIDRGRVRERVGSMLWSPGTSRGLVRACAPEWWPGFSPGGLRPARPAARAPKPGPGGPLGLTDRGINRLVPVISSRGESAEADAIRAGPPSRPQPRETPHRPESQAASSGLSTRLAKPPRLARAIATTTSGGCSSLPGCSTTPTRSPSGRYTATASSGSSPKSSISRGQKNSTSIRSPHRSTVAERGMMSSSAGIATSPPTNPSRGRALLSPVFVGSREIRSARSPLRPPREPRRRSSPGCGRDRASRSWGLGFD